jgi:hypothetical protein
MSIFDPTKQLGSEPERVKKALVLMLENHVPGINPLSDAAAMSARHTLASIALNFDSTDTGNCRVYYRHLRELFAYQMSHYRGRFALYACTKDGEPSHEVDYRQVDQLPRDYPEFAVWATDNNLVV